MTKRILMAFDDPGGGLVLSTLIEPLKKAGADLKIYSGFLSRKFADNNEFELLESHIDKKTAKDMFSQFNPDMLITGTSAGNSEQELRNYAYENNLTSVVILDFWKDYARRWYYAGYRLDEMKDYVFVMDNFTKAEMIEEGFPYENLIVTGHPYLDRIFNYNKEKPSEKSISNNYLFLSQPLKVIGIENFSIHPLEYLLKALKDLSSEREKINLKVKLHPVEYLTPELEAAVKKFNSDTLNIKVIKNEESIENMIDESGLVIGFNTIALFEARSKNKKTISLKASKVKESLDKAMFRAGIEIVEITRHDLSFVLKNKTFSERPEDFYKGAIGNCKREILKLLN